MKQVNAKDKNSFLIQTSIFIVPALISTLLFNIDDGFNLIQVFTIYRCGISGIFLIAFICIFMFNNGIITGINENVTTVHTNIASILVFLIYFFIFRSLYKTRYNNTEKTKLIFTVKNITIAIWGIFTGAYMMFLSRF